MLVYSLILVTILLAIGAIRVTLPAVALIRKSHPEQKFPLYDFILLLLRWRLWRQIGLGLVGVMILACLIAAGVLYFFFPKVTPLPALAINVRDTSLVNRGNYLANSVLACNQCHAPRDFSRFSGPVMAEKAWQGTQFPDIEFNMPGTLYAANLTPYHLQNWSDGEIYRLLTTGIRPDESPVFPIMSYPAFAKMDPNDVKAVVAYLRTLPSKENVEPQSQINFPLNLIMRAFSRKVEPTPLASLQTPVAKGKYLVDIAHCVYCHTPVKNGQEVKELAFAGGHEFKIPTGGIVRSANLTPTTTGIGNWTEEMFVQRFKAYRDPNNSRKVEAGAFNTVMPWTMYAQMTDEDLQAIYQYLRTLPPIEHATERFKP